MYTISRSLKKIGKIVLFGVIFSTISNLVGLFQGHSYSHTPSVSADVPTTGTTGDGNDSASSDADCDNADAGDDCSDTL